jgi:hypothetical protein
MVSAAGGYSGRRKNDLAFVTAAGEVDRPAVELTHDRSSTG